MREGEGADEAGLAIGGRGGEAVGVAEDAVFNRSRILLYCVRAVITVRCLLDQKFLFEFTLYHGSSAHNSQMRLRIQELTTGHNGIDKLQQVQGLFSVMQPQWSALPSQEHCNKKDQ